ncbi:MAG: DUF1232 domain-containing protein [Desulfobacterales bacterium]|jgi:hypothetical protein
MTETAKPSDKDAPAPAAAGIQRSGVAGIYDPKWIIVALCYIAAIALMGQDPWYGDRQFTYNQGIFVGVLAFLLVAGFCWESYLLGRPSGINLILQCLLIIPLALFIGRIAGLPPAPEASYGFLGQFKDYLSHLKDEVGFGGLMPLWIQDVFRNPGILLLILFTAIAFTQQKSSRRFALIVVAFLIPSMQTLAHDPRPSIFFGIGCLALIAGIALQYSRYAILVGQQNILQRLHAIADRSEWTCSLRISKQAAEDGFVTEDGVLAVVRRQYSEFYPSSIREIAQTLSHRLVREHRVLQMHGDERGFFLIPRGDIFKIDSTLDEIAIWIRKILITGLVILWLISPIDLLPDGIPILGALDDALISLVGAGQWLDTFRRRGPVLPTTP